MADIDDFDLKDAAEDDGFIPASPPPGHGLNIGLVAVGLVLLLGLGGVGFLLARKPGPTPTPLPSEPVTTAAVPTPSTGPTLPPGMPPLAESDAFIRDLAAGLSTHPQLAAWLEARGLARTFAASVLNIADGRSPASLVPFLAPKSKFITLDKGGRIVADPKSFQAYDALAEGVTSLDTAGVARAYRTALPLLSAAYRELGYPDGNFDAAMERALGQLLKTPIPEGEPALVKGPLGFRYADPALEGLSLAQKQLLRTGPANAKRLQDKLRDLYRELGFTPQA